MSDSNFITICPNCETQFRVTQGQLKVAQGQVRCGACLSVFNAEQQRKLPAQAQQPSAPQQAYSTQPSPQVTPQVQRPHQTQQPTQAPRSSQTSQIQQPTASKPVQPATADLNRSANDLGSSSTNTLAKQTPSPAKNDENKSAVVKSAKQVSQQVPKQVSQPLAKTSSEQLSKQRSKQLSKKLPEQPQQQTTTTVQTADKASAIDEHKQLVPLSLRAQRHDVKDTEFDIPTLDITAEPVVLQQSPDTKTPVSITWLCACLVATLLLATQYLWFNRAELYYTTTGQTLLAPICQQIDCNIAPQQQLEAIETQALRITPHKNIEGAIDVTVILQNTAHFAQPFPALSLSFSDLKGLTVAQRIFQPQEYLNTASYNPLQMSTQTPLQFTLEIMSPPPRASTYELELLAPDL